VHIDTVLTNRITRAYEHHPDPCIRVIWQGNFLIPSQLQCSTISSQHPAPNGIQKEQTHLCNYRPCYSSDFNPYIFSSLSPPSPLHTLQSSASPILTLNRNLQYTATLHSTVQNLPKPYSQGPGEVAVHSPASTHKPKRCKTQNTTSSFRTRVVSAKAFLRPGGCDMSLAAGFCCTLASGRRSGIWRLVLD
jgi:hypothetical protein